MKRTITIFLILIILLFSAGCVSDKGKVVKPQDNKKADSSINTNTKPQASIKIDQSKDIEVAKGFVEALRIADANTLKVLSKFTSKELTVEKVLKVYGEEFYKYKKDEIKTVLADMGPDVKGVFLSGPINDPGLVLIAIKVEKINNKYYVTEILEDTES
ncbi:MAG: hypothetical protein JG781_801 [Peptococcaceae bacterium]|nr:hypothetical protein [Peptococcaceae bacterium]